MQPAGVAHDESAAEHALRLVADLVVAALPLQDLARTALALNSNVSAAARRRLAVLLPRLRPLTLPPFNLQWDELLSRKKFSLPYAGLVTFAAACESGALPQLTQLRVNYNQVGDAGVQALGAALGSGALPGLQELWLNDNAIANAQQLADLAALPRLQTLYLAGSPISRTPDYVQTVLSIAPPTLSQLDADTVSTLTSKSAAKSDTAGHETANVAQEE